MVLLIYLADIKSRITQNLTAQYDENFKAN